MKKVVVNYANNKYRETQAYNTFTALKKGQADEVFQYSEREIDNNFYDKNKKILSEKRGNGLWLWKPYFIKKTLEKLDYGDIIFYTDSGSYFTGKINKVLDKVSDFDIICFDIPLIEEQFTKKIVFEKMDCNSSKYRKTNQIIATYFIIKKTKFTEKFINEWLELCTDYELIAPSDNKNEDEKFIAHREDQSIFSLLCKKYDIEPYSDISQAHYFPKMYKYDKRFIYKKLEHKNIKLPVIIYMHKINRINKIKLLRNKIEMIRSILY